MSNRPRMLDLCCKAGGAAMGYWRAGFDVIGVDIEPQPRYPFPFWRGDALEVLRSMKAGDFDAIHASPPCQAWTQMSARWRGQGGAADMHPMLIAPIRDELRRFGVPFVIENVPGARKELRAPVRLVGGQFGLGTHRPRLFESNVLLLTPQFVQPPADHVGVYGTYPDGRRLWTRKNGSGDKRSVHRCAKSVEEGGAAMGIDWMTWRELAEAIPPAYTEFIGRQLLRYVKAERTG